MPFSSLLTWYDAHGRSLPFRGTKDPYRVWLSETMLQQTRTDTVCAYYARFIALFPTVGDLALADETTVLKAWEGLGYYSRARNLHRAARIVHFEKNDVFPDNEKELRALPGIGEYTAGAVLSIAFGKPVPALDGNLIRVLSRVFAFREDTSLPASRAALKALAQAHIDNARPGDWNQALMDVGAGICLPKAARCDICPLARECRARAEDIALRLPVRPKPAPPKPVPVAVAFLRFGDRVLVTRRTQSLLRGLYVFYLLEGEDSREALRERLLRDGFSPLRIEPAGSGKHVFTHRVWQMRYWDVRLQEAFCPPWGQYLSFTELDGLPFPTAMRGALAALKSCAGRADIV